MEYIDLILDNHQIVRIECPDTHFDDCMESIEDTMKRGDWWSPARFEGCSATYIDHDMSRINMARVVGML